MKFCSQCNNMYYIAINSENNSELIHYCRFCGHRDPSLSEEGICVMKTNFVQGETKINHIVNKYTKFDPTLPRIHGVKCPNESCDTNTKPGGKTEIIYMRYNDEEMKYLYICPTCDKIWQTDEGTTANL